MSGGYVILCIWLFSFYEVNVFLSRDIKRKIKFWNWPLSFSSYKSAFGGEGLGIFSGSVGSFFVSPVVVFIMLFMKSESEFTGTAIDRFKLFLWSLIMPLHLVALLTAKSVRGVFRFFRRRFSKNHSNSAEDLVYFKNHSLNKKINSLTEKKKSVLKEKTVLQKIIEEWEQFINSISDNPEMAVEKEKYTQKLEEFRKILSEKDQLITEIKTAIKKIENQGQALDHHLSAHDLLKRTAKALGAIGNDDDVLKGDIETALSASRAIVGEIKKATGIREREVMARTGATVDELAGADLELDGIKKVNESTEEILKQAKKILA